MPPLIIIYDIFQTVERRGFFPQDGRNASRSNRWQANLAEEKELIELLCEKRKSTFAPISLLPKEAHPLMPEEMEKAIREMPRDAEDRSAKSVQTRACFPLKLI